MDNFFKKLYYAFNSAQFVSSHKLSETTDEQFKLTVITFK